MVDEFKTIRDNLFKAITGLGGSGADDDDETEDESGGPRLVDARATRALLQALFARAGKGKDEMVQIIAREIGMAVAAMLKEPLSQLARHQKLQISFEFVPKTPRGKAAAAGDDDDEDDEDESAEEDSDESDQEVEDSEDEEAPAEASPPPRRSRAKRASRTGTSTRRKTGGS